MEAEGVSDIEELNKILDRAVNLKAFLKAAHRDLLSEDAAFQQVVIVHELLHLLVPNHGKLFRSLMSAYVSEWERAGGLRIVGLCGSRRSR